MRRRQQQRRPSRGLLPLQSAGHVSGAVAGDASRLRSPPRALRQSFRPNGALPAHREVRPAVCLPIDLPDCLLALFDVNAGIRNGSASRLLEFSLNREKLSFAKILLLTLLICFKTTSQTLAIY